MTASRPTILLFDIDGTLLASDGAGRRALDRAFAARHGNGEACRGFSLAGMTDRAIARRGLETIGVTPSEAAITDLLAAYVGFLDDELRGARNFRVHAGVEQALDAAAARPGFAIGLGTGNLRAGAQKKLGFARLWERFSFGGFADDSEDRAALIRIGAERGARERGVAVAAARVVVIGDTPLDVAAARANSFEAFAVASGGAALAELAATRPEHAFESLAAAGAIERLLGLPAAHAPPVR